MVCSLGKTLPIQLPQTENQYYEHPSALEKSPGGAGREATGPERRLSAYAGGI